MLYPAPGTEGSKVGVFPTYGNFIGGKFVDPVKGEFADNPTPVTGKPFTQHAQSSEEDVELALDAAYKAAPAWGEASLAQRAAVLNKIADAVEANLEEIAIAECYDNGKAVRETLNADIPLLVDHFRYFAGAARTEEGTISEIDNDMVAYHFREPLGVVGQIIPFNFPLLMAAWKLAPALAAGNAVVLKPASPTPWSIMKLMEVIGDVVPPGVITMCFVASEINAPAEMARLLINAIVSGFAFNRASRMSIAASTRPPSVLTSKMIASASRASSKSAPRSRRSGVRASTASRRRNWPRSR